MTRRIGFLLGLSAFVIILSIPPLASFQELSIQRVEEAKLLVEPDTLAVSMQSVLAVLALMVIWWITEAVPLPATALLPAVLFPLLRVVGVQGSNLFEFTPRNALINYAHPVIFLFLGGFLLAGAMQKWKLDRRFTLWLLTRGTIANDTRKVLFAMMSATALLSMWISNTATAAMMLPLGLGILALMKIEPGKAGYGTALMLGIAWSASIGGVATIIGSPTNGVALGILNARYATEPEYQQISFLDWMKIGIPYIILYLPIAWLLLVKMFPSAETSIPGGKQGLLVEQKSLGPLSRGEKRTIFVFGLAVLLWVTNPFWDSLLPSRLASQLSWLDEYAIGLFCGLLLFFIPIRLRKSEFLLDWRDASFVDWGTLLLFGGGIALSDGMFRSGLAHWIATNFVGMVGSPTPLAMLFIIVFLVNFLTEITSNTAVVSMLVPVLLSIAETTGSNPVMYAVAAAVSASMAFMLPVATPPNALVFSKGFVKIGNMVRAGFLLNLIGWFLTVGIVGGIGGVVFGLF